MAKAIAIVVGGFNAKEEIKGHGGTWVKSAKMWVMTPSGFEKMKSRTQSWGMSAYRAIQACEGKVVDFTNGVVGEWIEPVSTAAPAPVAPAAPAAPVAPAAEITVELKSSEKRCVNYNTFARIKRDAAMEIARKIGIEKAKELFAKTKCVEYNQHTGDYSYYFDGTSARQYGDIFTIKFRDPNELEIEFAEYIKENPSCVNGFNPV